jgi:subtilisin family serine protease
MAAPPLAMRPSLFLLALTSAGILGQSGSAAAQVELRGALSKLAERGIVELPRSITRVNPHGRIPLLAEYDAPAARGQRYRPLWLAAGELAAMVRSEPGVKLHWSPPRYALVDEADEWVGGSAFRDQTGSTGQGVIVGIVDTGVEVGHGDLRHADGTSRIRYLVDFSRPPARRQRELESQYGCDGAAECAIYSGRDLDELLDNGVTGDEPSDTYGHGTHVASLAAGNGLSAARPRYVGIAPQADLIIARVSRTSGTSIFDADIVQATRFVFEQAERLGMPAVVNLSLGSDFGAHDGGSALEQALASLVGPDFPGRAIVVAAGNSGGLYAGLDNGLPEPLGVHTEVHIPHHSEAKIPIVTPTEAQGGSPGGTIYAWLAFRPGDYVKVAVDDGDEAWIPEILPGEASTFRRSGFEGTVFNGPSSPETSIEVGDHNAVVTIDGDFPAGRRFTLRLSGHGTARVWLQGSGGVSPDTSLGVLLARAQKSGTINIPAAHPDLIAVGASVNRNRWRDAFGKPFLVGQEGSDDLATVDGTAYFSAAGPNALGVIKPDLVAPGQYVVGAMGTSADPRNNDGTGVFASQGRCGDPDDYECFVVDDEHAVTSGTSMAAPIVSGAVALLLEQRPELTQPTIRALLQAGARRLSGPVSTEQQLGAGALDLIGTLAALEAEFTPLSRPPGPSSRIVLGSPLAGPDPNMELQGLLQLRDEDDGIADGFDERLLELEVIEGRLAREPERIAAGLYEFSVSAPAGSGGRTLQLRLLYDGELLSERLLPIAVDAGAAEGPIEAQGGCSAAPPAASSSGSWAFLAALVALRRRGRRRS